MSQWLLQLNEHNTRLDAKMLTVDERVKSFLRFKARSKLSDLLGLNSAGTSVSSTMGTFLCSELLTDKMSPCIRETNHEREMVQIDPSRRKIRLLVVLSRMAACQVIVV